MPLESFFAAPLLSSTLAEPELLSALCELELDDEEDEPPFLLTAVATTPTIARTTHMMRTITIVRTVLFLGLLGFLTFTFFGFLPLLSTGGCCGA